MIDAIIYKTHTGFTKRYAQMLSKETGIKAISSDNAKSELSPNSTVILFGWIRADHIRGLKKLGKLFNIVCVCAVGISQPDGDVISKLKSMNDLKGAPLFYLQGGFDIDKQDGLYKLIMNMAVKAMNKETDVNDENNSLEQIVTNGADFVDEKNLSPVFEWVKNNK